jgi:hypothetical protein
LVRVNASTRASQTRQSHGAPEEALTAFREGERRNRRANPGAAEWSTRTLF